MSNVQKLREIVGPVANQIKQRLDNNDPDLGPLAQFLFNWYERYEKQLETQELVEKSIQNKPKKEVEGGDNNA